MLLKENAKPISSSNESIIDSYPVGITTFVTLFLSGWVLEKCKNAEEMYFVFFLVNSCLFSNPAAKNPDSDS